LMDIGGLTAGSGYDQLLVTGTATLGGALNTALIGGFVPPPGSTFTLVQAASLSGTFATINQPPGALFNSFYGPTTFEFIAAGGGGASIPVPIAPTFNYAIVSTEQLSLPVIELFEPIAVSVVESELTTPAEGELGIRRSNQCK
jgi:hypothetical protein